MPNSNFLVFSESFYIKRFSNKGYRYHLGQEVIQPPVTIISELKTDIDPVKIDGGRITERRLRSL